MYEELVIKIIWFSQQDVVTLSNDEAADDLGGWNSGWFSKGNGND